MSTIPIEHDAEPPVLTSIPVIAFAEMGVGDAVTVPLLRPADYMLLKQRIHRFQKANKPKRFSIRKIGPSGVRAHEARIYRVEDYK